MGVKEISELFLTSIDKVEFYWNFYTVGVLAIVGWLASAKKALEPRLKLLISVGYLVFVIMNMVGLIGSYAFKEAIRADLLIKLQAVAPELKNATDVLDKFHFGYQTITVITIHSVVGALILYAVWFARIGNETPIKNGRVVQ